MLSEAPTLTTLAEVLDGFIGANAEGGATGMALVAAAFRCAGFEAGLPSRNDPRRIDVGIRVDNELLIATEVKQLDTTESVADSLAIDAADGQAHRALLVVLPPGQLVDFDRRATTFRAETHAAVVLRVTSGARELLHETLMTSAISPVEFCAKLPQAFGIALRDIRATDAVIDIWAALAARWH